MSLLVDLPEREADWKSQRIGVGRKIGMDLVGEAARQSRQLTPSSSAARAAVRSLVAIMMANSTSSSGLPFWA
jgi:hypothetical protein